MQHNTFGEKIINHYKTRSYKTILFKLYQNDPNITSSKIYFESLLSSTSATSSYPPHQTLHHQSHNNLHHHHLNQHNFPHNPYHHNPYHHLHIPQTLHLLLAHPHRHH